HRIEVRSLQSVDYVKVADVVYLTADGNYIELHTGTKTYVARIAIADMEQQLDPDHFFRVSRSAIVRISSVRSIHSMGRSHQAVLFSGEKVPVTRALDDLHERLKFAHE
ncbi:MAG: LytTR family DNA-binding domain-containing protein, partial [Verrucomicrobia bacterium]|nr:LytTR family DNA-binding domain-containing protein [Verrucomicrobiota bacterium]